MRTTRFFLFVIGCCLAPIGAQAQVKLSFNPEKGERYLYLAKMESATKQQMMGQEIPVDTSVDMLYEMNIQDKNADRIVIECTYREILMSTSSPLGNMKYDSKNGSENPTEMETMMAQLFGGMIEKPFRVTFDANGSVQSLSGWDAIVQDVTKSLTSNPQTGQMAAVMMQMFDEKAIRNMFEQSFNIYPDKPLNVGDTWNSTFNLPMMGMDNKMNSVFTLKAIDGDTALIDVASAIDFQINMNGAEGQVAGEQKGEMNLCLKTGMPVLSVTTQNARGNIKMQEMEMQMEMTMKHRFELQK
jgi:hypothetical protein